jgi:MFS family permease
MAQPVDAVAALGVLGDSQVRKLWAATLAQSLAVWIAQIALIVGVLEHHDGSSLAWVMLASSLPALLAGLAAGTIVDRHDPRRVAQAAATAGVVLLVGSGFGLAHSLGAGTACYALFLVVRGLSGPASIRVLYATVPPGQRTAGNAAIASVSGISTIAGAAIGGVGVAALGVVDCFALAAGIQGAAAVAFLLLAPPGKAPQASEARLGFRRSLVEGVTAVRGYPLAASIILIGIAWGLIGGGYDVLIGLYGTHVLRGGGGVALGVLYAADGIGVLAGTILAPRLPRRHVRRSYALAYGLQGALWAIFALGHNLLQAVPALLLMRVASGVIIALDTTLLLATVPERLHGRLYAVHSTTYGTVGQVSLAITGILLESASPRTVTVAAGMASIAAGAVWWLAIRGVSGADTEPDAARDG